MRGTHLEGAEKQLHSIMDMAVNGMMKYQTTPPGFRERSEKEKEEIFYKILGMERDERESKLSELSNIIGDEQLIRFLVEQSRKMRNGPRPNY